MPASFSMVSASIVDQRLWPADCCRTSSRRGAQSDRAPAMFPTCQRRARACSLTAEWDCSQTERLLTVLTLGLCQLCTDSMPGIPGSQLRPLLHVAVQAAADSLHKLQQARWRSAQLPASQPALLSPESCQPVSPSTTPAYVPDCPPPSSLGTACLPACSSCMHTSCMSLACSPVELSLCVPSSLQNLTVRIPRQPTYSTALAQVGLAGGLLCPFSMYEAADCSQNPGSTLQTSFHPVVHWQSSTRTGTSCLRADSRFRSLPTL